MQTFFEAYIEAAMWSSTDDNQKPLEDNYCETDIDPKSLATMRKDCENFQDECKDLLAQAYQRPGYTEASAGHDFWLNRNGHGCGFWDRDLDDVGDQLSEKCKPYGSQDLLVGDNGTLYV